MAYRVTVRLHAERLYPITRGTPGIREIRRRAREVQRAAKRLAPVDTGRLRRGIIIVGPLNASSGLFCYVISTAPYSGYVEYGTRYMRAQPFMRPAIFVARAAG